MCVDIKRKYFNVVSTNSTTHVNWLQPTNWHRLKWRDINYLRFIIIWKQIWENNRNPDFSPETTPWKTTDSPFILNWTVYGWVIRAGASLQTALINQPLHHECVKLEIYQDFITINFLNYHTKNIYTFPKNIVS